MAYLGWLSSHPLDQVSFRLDPPLVQADPYRALRGMTLAPGEVPARAVVTTARKKLSPLVAIHTWWGVSDTFRGFVEAREPGVHQFFPIEIVLKNATLPEPYWIMNVRQRIDAVVVEKSRVTWEQFPNGKTLMYAPSMLAPGERPYPLVLDKRIVAGRHVWRGDTQLNTDTFFSDDLISAYKAVKMRGLNLKYSEEV